MEQNKNQFIYILKLIPRLLDESNWSAKENDIVGRHFKRLQELLADGRLILAGRTQIMDENTFGLVILEVDSEAEARLLMENDPSVKEGIMTAELFPYKVALMRR